MGPHFLPSKLRKPMMVFALFFTSCCFASLPMYFRQIVSVRGTEGWNEGETRRLFAVKRDRAGDLTFSIFISDTFWQSLLQLSFKKSRGKKKLRRALW
jgi:hypothetical protein